MKKKNKKNEIMWNVVNSCLAGGLVFIGSLTSGQITKDGIIAAFLAGAVVALTKFKDFWTGKSKVGGKKGSIKLFNFLG